jgi:hypothetical protein
MGKSTTEKCENCEGLDKACKSGEGKQPPFIKEEMDIEKNNEEEEDDEKKKKKVKKSKEDETMNNTEEVQKSSPEEETSEDQIMLIDDVVDEVTKSVDLALQALAMRTAFFMKSLEDYSLQQVEGLTGRLAETSELITKSFGIVEGEDHVPESAPKSITSADEVSKSEGDTEFSHEQVLHMMQKSLDEGNTAITPADITNFEMTGNYRPEVLESLGITVE